LPGEFPYLNGAYREMYLEPLREIETGSYGNRKSPNGDSHNGAGRVSRAKIPEAAGTAATTGGTDSFVLRPDAG